MWILIRSRCSSTRLVELRERSRYAGAVEVTVPDADAEAARQKRLERLRAEAKAAEEAGALGLKSEAD